MTGATCGVGTVPTTQARLLWRDVIAAFTFSQLTPTAFLERSARVFPDRTAVVDGDRRFTYR